MRKLTEYEIEEVYRRRKNVQKRMLVGFLGMLEDFKTPEEALQALERDRWELGIRSETLAACKEGVYLASGGRYELKRRHRKGKGG